MNYKLSYYYFFISPCSDSLNNLNPRIESPTKPEIVNTDASIIVALGTIVPAKGWSGGAISFGINVGTKTVGFRKRTMPMNSNTISIIKVIVDWFIFDKIPQDKVFCICLYSFQKIIVMLNSTDWSLYRLIFN